MFWTRNSRSTGKKYVLLGTALVLLFSFVAISRIQPYFAPTTPNPDPVTPDEPNKIIPLPATPTVTPTSRPLAPLAIPIASKTQEDCSHGVIFSPEDSLDAEIKCDHSPLNFWLMWTTGREGWKLKHYRVIDSIFSIHPNALVHILTKNMTEDDFSFYANSFKIFHHKLEYDKIFKHTPLYAWILEKMNTPEIVNHLHFFSHVTDLMRLALLWKYGGVYMDTDAILMKNIDKVRNAIGFQGPHGNGEENYNGNHFLFFLICSYLFS